MNLLTKKIFPTRRRSSDAPWHAWWAMEAACLITGTVLASNELSIMHSRDGATFLVTAESVPMEKDEAEKLPAKILSENTLAVVTGKSHVAFGSWDILKNAPEEGDFLYISREELESADSQLMAQWMERWNRPLDTLIWVDGGGSDTPLTVARWVAPFAKGRWPIVVSMPQKIGGN